MNPLKCSPNRFVITNLTRDGNAYFPATEAKELRLSLPNHRGICSAATNLNIPGNKSLNTTGIICKFA